MTNRLGLLLLLPLAGCIGAQTRSIPGADEPIIPGSMCLTLLARDGLGIPTVKADHQPIAVRIALPRRQERLAEVDLHRLSLPSGVFLDQPRLSPYPVSSGALMPLRTPKELAHMHAGGAMDPHTTQLLKEFSELLSRMYAKAMGADSLLGQGMTVSPVINTFTGNLFACSLDAAALWRGLNVMVYRVYNGLARGPGPFGPGWTHNFAARLDFNEDQSIQYTRWDGSRFCYRADGKGKWESPDGFGDELTRSGTGYMIEDETGFFLLFNAGGTLTEIGNPLPFRLKLKYDASNRLVEVRNVRSESGVLPGLRLDAGQDTPTATLEGPGVILAYDEQGRITQIRSTSGSQMDYVYDNAGRLNRATSNTRQTVEYRYDQQGRLAEIRRADPTGLQGVVLFGIGYDEKDRVKEVLDAAGRPTMGVNYRWALDRTTEIVLGQLHTVVVDRYDERGILIERSESQRSEDPAQNADSRSKRQQRACDDRLNVLRMDRQDGSHTRWTYDELGRLVRAQDSTGEWVEISYDREYGLAEYLRESHGRWVRFRYESDRENPTKKHGRVVEVELDDGNRYKLGYDDGGVPRELINATGETQPLDLGLPPEVPKALWEF